MSSLVLENGFSQGTDRVWELRLWALESNCSSTYWALTWGKIQTWSSVFFKNLCVEVEGATMLCEYVHGECRHVSAGM